MNTKKKCVSTAFKNFGMRSISIGCLLSRDSDYYRLVKNCCIIILLYSSNTLDINDFIQNDERIRDGPKTFAPVKSIR